MDKILQMKLPPADEDGNTLPHDHEQIADNHFVIRRVSDKQIAIDKKTGEKRLSSMVYKASSEKNGSMSVDLEHLILQAGICPKEHVTHSTWVGSIKIKAEDIRSSNFQVGYDPINDNPYHGGIWGNFSKKNQNHLRSGSQWFVEIEGVSIQA